MNGLAAAVPARLDMLLLPTRYLHFRFCVGILPCGAEGGRKDAGVLILHTWSICCILCMSTTCPILVISTKLNAWNVVCAEAKRQGVGMHACSASGLVRLGGWVGLGFQGTLGWFVFPGFLGAAGLG